MGLLQGAWDAVWSTITGLAGLAKLPFDLVVGLVRDLLTGTLVGKAKELWDVASQLNPGALLEGAGTLLGLALTDFAAKWNDPDVIKKWNFRGFVVGEAVAQVLLTFFSGGELLAARVLSRVGRLADLIVHVGAMGRLRAAVGALTGGAADAVRGALRGLAAAHAWAASALKIPAEVLVDLSEDAINRLRTLPDWLLERLSRLNPSAMRRVLGCASPCMVDVRAVRRYLTELAATDETGARELTTMQQVIDALGLPSWADTAKLEDKLRRTDVMYIIRAAKLTDKDFARLRDFVPVGRHSLSEVDTYDLFSQYLSALVPSKVGPSIDAFFRLTSDFNRPAGRALKGAMFENFARLYLFADKPIRRAVIHFADHDVYSDFFDETTGALWDCKNQKSALAKKLINKYVGVLGQRTTDDKVVRSVNFLFPTRTLAELNEVSLKGRGFRVWYVIQQGTTPTLTRL